MKNLQSVLGALALGVVLASPAMAQTANTQTVTLPLTADTLSIADQTAAQDSGFTAVALTGVDRTAVALTLSSGTVPTYVITNPGASAAGFSVTLSTTGTPGGTNPPTNLNFDGTSTVTPGTGAGDITATKTGGAIQTAPVKVLSVIPAGAAPPFGTYLYALGTTGWSVDIPGAASPGTAYTWTLTATISDTP